MEGRDRIAAGPSFDAHHPPDPDLVDDCVHCGFCLPVCPTYNLWREEMDSPRGRIYLMKLANEGGTALTPSFVDHMDRCLGCMACMTACPSGVQYGKLIEATRAQVERNAPRSTWDRLYRSAIFALFPHPRRLRVLAWPLWLYQATGLARAVEGSGLLRLFPARVAALARALPPLTASSLRARVPARIAAIGEPRLRVGLVTGCVQSVFFGRVNEATARVLAAEGCDVVAPPSQGCCGALSLHVGRDALDFARRTIAAFEREPVDAIAINAAGCGSTLKEYGDLLRDDPEWASRAAAFAAKCRDVSEILANLEPRAPRHPLPIRVVYQDACHLRHAQRVEREPRAVLATIPGLEVVPIAGATECCGSAGVYSLLEPETAGEIGARKATNVLAAAPDAVVSSNPGCALQIGSALGAAGSRVPVVHLVELLDASIRGLAPREALGGN
jgi:glycolate oxidase iron-sulfur subunit